MATVTVRIPQSLLKRARRSLDQSRREERAAKVRRFKSARDAVEYLKQR